MDTFLCLDIVGRAFGPSLKQCVLSSLGSGWGMGLGEEVERMGGGEKMGTEIGILNEKIVCFLFKN